MTAISDITPAMIKGNEAECATVRADIAGPKMKPNPNDAPIIPNPRVLCSCEVVSDIIAEATGIFPAVMPSSARAKNKNIALGANAMIKNEIAVPKIEMIRRGLLPYLSDILPMMGVEMNWQIENNENKSPF